MPLKYPELITLDTIQPRDIEWLWFPYFPRSAASLLFGPGGVGKSAITCKMAADMSNGTPFPGQTGTPRPQRVLMMSAEDEYDTVLVPRLMKMNANLSRIAVPKEPFTLDKAGIRQIERYMEDFTATICFIDPIVHYFGAARDMNRSNEVREFVGELHQSAIRTGHAVILVGHSRKGHEGADWERAMGSVDFINGVRSVLYAHVDDDNAHIMQHVKSNYSKPGSSITYSFEDNTFQWGEFLHERPALTASHVHSNQMKLARAWIKQYLSTGPVPANEAKQAALDEGFSQTTLQRAKDGLVESFQKRTTEGMRWYWRLIDSDKTNLPRVERQRRVEVPKRHEHIDGMEQPKPNGRDKNPIPPVVDRGRDEIIAEVMRRMGADDGG